MEARSQLRHRPTQGYPYCRARWLIRQTDSDQFSAERNPAMRGSIVEDRFMKNFKDFKCFSKVILFLIMPLVASVGRSYGQVSMQAQPNESAGQQASLPKTGDLLGPALATVTHALSTLNIEKWKTSGSMRNSARQDAASIQRDLDGTLPGLISQADSSPSSVAGSFAVYRNVDALYDVLLRVTETAHVGAPRAESGELDFALSRLEAARKTLGDGIMNASQEHEAQLVKLQAALRAAAQPAKPPVTTVVNDGPAPAAVKAKRKHKKVVHPTVQPQQPQ
ncbi:hypothetical protein [Acidipila rosea]|nr:hypothetical protein [Acidipila rosea]MBW4045559.1 hypothetical protein [Acidobacteriota bacterium]